MNRIVRTLAHRFRFVASLLPVFGPVVLGAALMPASTAEAQVSTVLSGSTNVGSTATGTVTVTVATTGSVSSIGVLTAGTANLDFTAGTQSGTTCATGSVTSGTTCTYTVNFSPKYPGLRSGAVVLYDGSGAPLGTGLVSGVGVASLSVMQAGELMTVAGNGHLTDTNTNSAATNVAINEPLGVAFDGAGNFYFSDSGGNVIQRVDTSGNLTTYAGTGAAGYAGDGGLATAATLSAPAGIILDGAGNLYFADSGNSAIREIIAGSGKIVTVAGNGTRGFSANGTVATSAELNEPEGLALDPSGNLFIADTLNNVVRKVDATTRQITTIAGTGVEGFDNSSQNGVATTKMLGEPWGLFATADGSVYVADFLNNVIRKVDTSGNITTVVGSGSSGYTNNVTALSTAMNHPAGVVVDAAGDIIITDSENDAILKMNSTTQMVTRLGGNENSGWDADGVDADPTLAEFNKPYGLAIDGAGDLLIADRINLRVREIMATVGAFTFQAQKMTQTSSPEPQVIENDGNAALNLTTVTAIAGPKAGDSNINAAIAATGTTCTAGAQLLVGGTCTVMVEFRPEELSVYGTVNGSTQLLPVVGLISVVSDSASSPVGIEPSGISESIYPTTTTVTGTPNPSSLGGAVTLTATMTTGNSAALTGTVTFYEGSTVLGGAAQNLAGTTNTATLTISTLTLGSHTIYAVYSGDAGDATSTSPNYTQVVKQGTTVAVAGSPNPAAVYGSVTFTATVTPTAGSTTPGGTVTFSVDGNVVSAALAMTGNTASYTTSTLTAGTHSVTAAYSGDTSDLSSTSPGYSETVNVAATTSTLGTSNASVSVETAVTFTATVTGNTAGAVPSGSVAFYDGTTQIGTGLVTGSGYVGSASYTTSSLVAGTHSITAKYLGDTNYGVSTTAALVETVNKIATSATVAASANATTAGSAASFTVVVTAGSATTPNLAVTGTITLKDGTTTIGTGTLAASGAGPATATVVISSTALTPGSHAITASYAGDGNYLATATSALALTVTNASTTTSLAASASTLIAQKPLMLTATVAGTGGTPTGTVTFLDGANAIGTGTLHSGVATVTTTALAVGTHTITASYTGDTNNAASVSIAVTVTAQSATTATALAVAPNPAQYGQSVTMTATVTGNGGTPGGTVTFLDGGTALGAAVALNASGTASYTTTSLSDGIHTITAHYSGDANDTTSGSTSVSLSVVQTATLTVTTTTGNPAAARTDVHLVATLTPLQSIVPTGTITFLDGGTAIGTGTLTMNGTVATATFDTTTLAVATHQITVSYAGDGKTEAVTSAAYPLTVAAVGSSVTVTASSNPAVFGKVLTFTASVTSTTGVPTGTVKFEDGGAVIGTGTLSGGKTTFATSTLTAGVHTIEAVYSGDADDSAGTSPAITVTEQRATTTTITSSENPLPTLASVVITATVSNGGGTAATGTMTFTQDGLPAGTATVTNGVATLSVPSLAVGNHIYGASYSGDAIDLASTAANFTEAVQLRPTTDLLTSSATSLSGGQQVTLISVVQYSGSVVPTGTVLFLAGTVPIASTKVDADGVATVTALLGSGPTVNVTAVYSGDENYATSTSAQTVIAITSAPNFNMSLTPTTFSLVTKQHTSLTMTLSSVNNFTDTFALGCPGLPFGATCTFTQDSVVLPAGGTATVSVTVDTGDPLGGGTQATAKKAAGPLDGTSSTMMACLVPGGLLMGLLGLRMRRYRKLGGLLLLIVLAGATTVLSGCAGLTMGSTPAGTYNFRVTAVGATGVSQSATVTMTVTN